MYLLFHIFDNRESYNEAELIAICPDVKNLHDATLDSVAQLGAAPVDLRFGSKGDRKSVEALCNYLRIGKPDHHVLMIEEWPDDDLSGLADDLFRARILKPRVTGARTRLDRTESDALVAYETVLKLWPACSIQIFVKRLTGAPTQTVINTHPESSVNLYSALLAFHGAHEEAEYEVDFFDAASKQYRARRRITLPDTRQPPPTDAAPEEVGEG